MKPGAPTQITTVDRTTSASRSHRHAGRSLPVTLSVLLLLTTAAVGGSQTTGQIYGRVVEAESERPVSGAVIEVAAIGMRALTSESGDFILVGVPTGIHELRVERIGFHPVVLHVRVRASRATQLNVALPIAPLAVEGVVAEVERLRLIEPDVTVSHEVVLGRELRQLPVDDVEEAVELTVGVTEGRFRGGRLGQEVYSLDGLELKEQVGGFESGPLLEMPPGALEEIEVVTGGFGAHSGSALSGVVSYVSRRGGSEAWEGQGALATDGWISDLSSGYSSLSLSAGGPLHFLGRNTALFAAVLAQGMVDADPRARGLTCLRPDDGDEDLAAAIAELSANERSARLYCPFVADRLPYQRGDKLLGFLRVDRPVSAHLNLMLTALHNRRQQELYTPEFKYNADYQLGRRFQGSLASLTADWSAQHTSGGYHVVARGAFLRLDRYLGVIDPWTFRTRARVAGFGFADYRFLGEAAARAPIEDQLASPAPLPGYSPAGGSSGSPFGPAAEGIFFTEGTPGIAAWNRADLIGADLVGEILSTRGHAFRAGFSTRLYDVEAYERPEAYLAGSLPSFARFFPTTLSGFAEVSLLAAQDVTIELGLRMESFSSGVRLEEDPIDLLTPVVDSDWHTEVMPRIGVAIPVPGSDERTMFRFNYSRLAEPPDFRFFLDTTIGDSLRTDITRQGDPNLSFERGTAWELGISHLISDRVSVSGTGFYKELHNLVTSTFVPGALENQFTTGDFGTVKGIELTVQGRWPALRFRAGYALQDARGLTSSPFEDPGSGLIEQQVEFPLAFDSRHAADVTLLAGNAAGSAEHRWGLALTGSMRSGYPLDRSAADATEVLQADFERLPWIGTLSLRLSHLFAGIPGCRSCAWRLFAEGRNVLGRDNVIALRRDTGSLAPGVEGLSEAAAADTPSGMAPIPIESPRYSAGIDLDNDGLVSAGEMEIARFAALLDRNDPSLFFGPARELRLGLEVEF